MFILVDRIFNKKYLYIQILCRSFNFIESNISQEFSYYIDQISFFFLYPQKLVWYVLKFPFKNIFPEIMCNFNICYYYLFRSSDTKDISSRSTWDAVGGIICLRNNIQILSLSTGCWYSRNIPHTFNLPCFSDAFKFLKRLISIFNFS